jgi:hypothetical protein
MMIVVIGVAAFQHIFFLSYPVITGVYCAHGARASIGPRHPQSTSRKKRTMDVIDILIANQPPNGGRLACTVSCSGHVRTRPVHPFLAL